MMGVKNRDQGGNVKEWEWRSEARGKVGCYVSFPLVMSGRADAERIASEEGV
jgi:hypothetical protein